MPKVVNLSECGIPETRELFEVNKLLLIIDYYPKAIAWISGNLSALNNGNICFVWGAWAARDDI